MIVSWNWLKQYVRLDMPVDQLAHRLTMAGLNLEEVSDVDGDIAIDLEVTSNRPDCLGHLGVAREVAVLYHRELTVPDPRPAEAPTPALSATRVEIHSEDLCPRYLARVIRGTSVRASPDWLVRRLKTVGLRSINNVVDATNYVMLECGQPLHAFDHDRLAEGRIVVRRAAPGEKITAIDQREYALPADACVIADARRPVAVAGVMGGFDTEIHAGTTNVLLEAAEFAPRTVRNTARALNLHSPSSYRFERGIDAAQLDWASRRCAEIILQTGGGELLQGVAAAGKTQAPAAQPVALPFRLIERLLGVELPRDEVLDALQRLGLRLVEGSLTADGASFLPPSWRRDLTRAADLVEEAARILGYERIPDDAAVPLAVSTRPRRDKVVEQACQLLVGQGFYEAMTLSFVDDAAHERFRCWTDRPPLRVEHSSRRKENILRQSLIPSLLHSRRENERHGQFDARLFETARIYLEACPGRAAGEPMVLGLVTGQSFAETKGILEELAACAHPGLRLEAVPTARAEFEPGQGAELRLDGRRWGWLGVLSRSLRDELELRESVTVAEIDLAPLEAAYVEAPLFQPIAAYPAVDRDLNFVLDEAVPWKELEEAVRRAAGPHLVSVEFGGQYRGQQIPAGKKSYVVALRYQSAERTLTAEEVDAAQQAVIAACQSELSAALRT